MYLFPKYILRFLSLASVSLLVALSFSCKKDKSEPNPSGPNSPGNPTSTSGLIASANLNFVTDNETIDFKCYNLPFFEEVVITEDSTLTMIFKSVEQNGAITGGPSLTIYIENGNGFNAGDIYSYANSPNNQEFSFIVTRDDSTGLSGYYGLDSGSTGELKITSFNGTKMIGVFDITLISAVDPTSKVIVSNGKFEADVFFQN